MTSKYKAVGDYGAVSNPSNNTSIIEIRFHKNTKVGYDTISEIEFVISSTKNSKDHKKLKLFIENIMNGIKSNVSFDYKNGEKISTVKMNAIILNYDGIYFTYNFVNTYQDINVYQKYKVNNSLLKALERIYKALDSR